MADKKKDEKKKGFTIGPFEQALLILVVLGVALAKVSASSSRSSSSSSSSSASKKPLSSSDVRSGGLPSSSSSKKVGDPTPRQVSGSTSSKDDPSSSAFRKNYFLTMQGPGRPALVPFQDGLRPKKGDPAGTLWWDNVPDVAIVFFLWKHFTNLHDESLSDEKDAIEKEKKEIAEKLRDARKAGMPSQEYAGLQMALQRLG
ncbi:uncharacterized protein IL334_007100 [Kwoniella shivajii]|uniref:Uncharacterized protein n=1 Tax=Kwoniella shivajii TaxID=564305 RepID=A0ABZ1D7R9_9TREE|nr:hypothetical protein IL334_007100 [Kwoniella shivajii]